MSSQSREAALAALAGPFAMDPQQTQQGGPTVATGSLVETTAATQPTGPHPPVLTDGCWY
jgi:hypothetical protein